MNMVSSSANKKKILVARYNRNITKKNPMFHNSRAPIVVKIDKWIRRSVSSASARLNVVPRFRGTSVSRILVGDTRNFRSRSSRRNAASLATRDICDIYT